MIRFKKYIFASLFLCNGVSYAATHIQERFTEFYCSISTNSSNLNAGSTNGATTYWSPTGTWYSSGSFTTPGANLSQVTTGQIASVYSALYGTTSFIAVISSVNDTTDVIMVNLASSSRNGLLLTTSASSRLIRVGGSWRGPNDSLSFPFGFISTASVPSASIFPRVNFLQSSSFSITAGMTHAVAGPVRFQGYSSVPGDLGKAFIDAASTSTSIILLTASASNIEVFDIAFSSNGAGATNALVVSSGQGSLFKRCVFYNSRGHGLTTTAGSSLAVECEAYKCNMSNGSAAGGFNVAGGVPATYIRCFSHHNLGTNSSGFVLTNSNVTNLTMINCIASSNGQYGLNSTVRNGRVLVVNSDFYNNVSDGIRAVPATASGVAYISNSNFISNGGYGINHVRDPLNANVHVENCGFGVGISSNAKGNTVNISTGTGSNENSINYPINRTPWINQDFGNFTLNMSEAQESGAGGYQLHQSTYSGPSIAYPDIGAVTPRRKRGGYGITQ